MAYSQLLYTRTSAPVPPSTSQISSRSPSSTPPTRCCDNGRPITKDPHTGQTICSCQYSASLIGFPRVPGLPEGVYAPSLNQHPGVLPIGTDPSAFYSPLQTNVPYDIKENVEAWRSLQQAGGCLAYDPTMALYPYAGYSGLDLNGARRKNATRETTTTLKHWLYEHRKNPYPTKGEKIMLAIITKMTLTQVSTWFANARRRLKKENKMTWTPRNRADDGMDPGATEDSDIDIDDDFDDEDKAKLQDAGLLSPNKDHESRIQVLDCGDSISDERSSHKRERNHSGPDSPVDMRKSPSSPASSDTETNGKSDNRLDMQSENTEKDTELQPLNKILLTSPPENASSSTTGKPTMPKIWSVSDLLTKTTRSSDSSRSSPVITTSVQSLPSQSNIRPHCGVTLVPSAHGWIGCRVPLGYPIGPHSLPYQYALKQHILSRTLGNKPSTLVNQSDLARHSSGHQTAQTALFSPARDVDVLRNRLYLDKSASSIVI